jgi:thiol:disulfide interchange protein
MKFATWIGIGALVLSALAARGLAAGGQDPQPKKEQTPPAKPVYDEQADAARDVAAALARAQAKNRRVLIQWGANWCGWCTKLNGLFTVDMQVKRKLLYEYDVVHVDVGRFDKNLALAASFGADVKASGLPFLTVLDGAGQPLANQETGSLEDGDHHSPAKVLEFLTKHQAPYWDALELYAKALERAKQGDKRLFVLYGAPW